MSTAHPQRPFQLHHLLARAAVADPSKDAVRCAGRSLAYGELLAAANGLARGLITRGGVARGDRVGIHLPKCVELVASVYGTLQAGAAYVPLDPKAPVRRLGMVAADCTVAALVTTPDRAAELVTAMEGHAPRLVVLVGGSVEDLVELPCPVVSFREITADASAEDPQVAAIEEDLAYILYTSGSTGVPKGVMLTHRNALAFVEWSAHRIGVGPGDRLSNHAPLHFDLSVFDLYLAALGGATLVLVPEEQAYFGSALADLIRKEELTVWYSVPSALMLLTRLGLPPGSLPSLRAVVFAGEVYPTKHLRELRALVPDAELWNIYGPTETNVVTYYRVGELPEDDRTIPIGRACEGSEVFALTEDGRVAGVGEEGELLARGPTVMKGYWSRPEKTAEVLVPDPRPGSLGDHVYRTGDLVRLRPDGDYEFLGRRDHQIKSRGYRIELGEIEAALNAHPSLVEAVAVAIPHEEWGKAIVAHVVPRNGVDLSQSHVKKHLLARIPRYMIPARIEFRGALPRNPNGKIDRRKIQQEAEATPLG
jgi:amino acid adenylation domain-containing protein